MKVIRLSKPQHIMNGFAEKDDPIAAEYRDTLQEIYDTFLSGKLYVRFYGGDRKGSIAHLIPDPQYAKANATGPTIEWHRGFYNNSNWRIEGDMWFGHFTWDGRRNKVKSAFPSYYDECEYLIDYDGPTVWEMFDAKAAKAEALKNPDIKDFEGHLLSVGDKVLYINARYGSGMVLDRGEIKEFKVVADSKKTEISVIIENEHGQASTLKYPEAMVSKVFAG